MSTRSVAGHLGAAVIAALALGGLATFFRLLPSSTTLTASVLTFALAAVAVGAGVLVGGRGRPDETAYW